MTTFSVFIITSNLNLGDSTILIFLPLAILKKKKLKILKQYQFRREYFATSKVLRCLQEEE